MQNLDELRRSPWLIDQKDIGFCGFVSVLIRLILIDSPLLLQLQASVLNTPITDSPTFVKVQRSVQRRIHFHLASRPADEITFPNRDIGNDFDLYMVMALLLFFKKECKNQHREALLTECFHFTAELMPHWRSAGSPTRPGIKSLKDIEGVMVSERLSLKDIYEEFAKFSHKTGHLALNIPAMQFLLNICNIRFTLLPSIMPPLDALHTAVSEKRVEHLYLRNYANTRHILRTFKRGNPTFGVIASIKYVSEFLEKQTSSPFNHWVYIHSPPATDGKESFIMWSWGNQFELKDDLYLFMKDEGFLFFHSLIVLF